MNAFEEAKAQLQREPKTWLVTGNAGFIGSNLTEFLLSHGQKVVGVDNFSTGFRHNIEDVLGGLDGAAAENFTFIEGDIADMAVCRSACEGVDIVLHQAALGSVPRSIEDPVTSNRSNVTGFLNLITAAKEAGVERFVYASSSSVYGDSKELPKVEERTGNLLSPYAVMKKTNELYADVFCRTYGIGTIGLRYFNVFGRRQTPDGAYAAVIPKWIGALLRDEAVHINGDGETSRDFTYIDNVIQMNVLAGVTRNPEAVGQVFNVAAGGRNTLNELYGIIVDNLNRYLGQDQKPIDRKPLYRDFRTGDIRHSNADVSKAKRLVGYAPTHDILAGMEAAIAWYVDDLRSAGNI